MDNKFYVYILECNDSTLYTGYTNNLEKRITLHNSSKGAKYTSSRLPVKYVYIEQYEDKSSALKRETAIKKLRRQDKLKLIDSYLQRECD